MTRLLDFGIGMGGYIMILSLILTFEIEIQFVNKTQPFIHHFQIESHQQ